MIMDYEILALIISVFSAIFAVVAVLLESRRSRIALQADLLLRLDERFYSSEMIKMRQEAARRLLKKEQYNYELDDILDFFTTLDLLVEYKALDAQLTYEVFSYWVTRYWYCAKEYVIQSREYDPESWIGVEELADRLITKELKRAIPPPSKDELGRFLMEETRARPKKPHRYSTGQGTSEGHDKRR